MISHSGKTSIKIVSEQWLQLCDTGMIAAELKTVNSFHRNEMSWSVQLLRYSTIIGSHSNKFTAIRS